MTRLRSTSLLAAALFAALCAGPSSAAPPSAADRDNFRRGAVLKMLAKVAQKGTFAVLDAGASQGLVLDVVTKPFAGSVLTEGTWQTAENGARIFTITAGYQLGRYASFGGTAGARKMVADGCTPSDAEAITAVFANPGVRKLFRAFLAKESNQEPLDLVLELEALRQDPKPRVADWNKLVDAYVRDSGAKQVNLGSQLRKDIEATRELQKEFKNPENLLKSVKFKELVDQFHKHVVAELLDPAPRFVKMRLGAGYECKVVIEPKAEKAVAALK